MVIVVTKTSFVQFICVFLPPLLNIICFLLDPYHICHLLYLSLHEMFLLVSLIFLTRSLIFPILLFSSISLHHSPKKTFLFLLTVLWISAFSWVYPCLSHLPLLLFLVCNVLLLSCSFYGSLFNFIFATLMCSVWICLDSYLFKIPLYFGPECMFPFPG